MKILVCEDTGRICKEVKNLTEEERKELKRLLKDENNQS
jgi:hypothetical protein